MTPSPSPAGRPADTSSIPWRLVRSPPGRLDLVDATGQVHTDIDLVRAFPLSAPEGPVAILSSDGRELAWIESPSTLPPEARRMLADELAERDFRPVIKSILAITLGEPAQWQVLTDRGACRFATSHVDAIERRADGSLVVTDTHGTRFLIPHTSRLDRHSRVLLAGFLP
jgi:hypothetical protein